MENKENTRPYGDHNGSNGNDSDDSDEGPILYRDEPVDRAVKIARKESLSLKLALRPDRQELINRNILRIQTENDQVETKEAIGARLIRRLSMRPSAEELVERNILKSTSIHKSYKHVGLNLINSYSHICIRGRKQINEIILFSLHSPNARRVKEIEGGEEKLLATKIKFSSDR